MEQSKLYNALMIIFENEETWFNECAELDQETLNDAYYDCDGDLTLVDKLKDVNSSNEQIAFADEHWLSLIHI